MEALLKEMNYLPWRKTRWWILVTVLGPQRNWVFNSLADLLHCIAWHRLRHSACTFRGFMIAGKYACCLYIAERNGNFRCDAPPFIVHNVLLRYIIAT